MKEKLFWVAAVRYPTKKAAEDGVGAELILSAQLVLAEDDGAARLKAAKLLPEDVMRVEVFVRPF